MCTMRLSFTERLYSYSYYQHSDTIYIYSYSLYQFSHTIHIYSLSGHECGMYR